MKKWLAGVALTARMASVNGWIIPAGLVMWTVAGCATNRSLPEQSNHARLKADAIAMVERWDATRPEGRSIDPSFWPDSLRRLEPVEVYPHMFGVVAVTSKTDRYHHGIYIVTDGQPEEELDLSSGSGTSYRRIEPGLHEVTIKVRRRVE